MSKSQAQKDYRELCGTIQSPAIERALEVARCVDTLNAWVAENASMRRWFLQSYVGGYTGCRLLERTPEHRWGDDGAGHWEKEFGDRDALDIPLAALRLAVNHVDSVTWRKETT